MSRGWFEVALAVGVATAVAVLPIGAWASKDSGGSDSDSGQSSESSDSSNDSGASSNDSDASSNDSGASSDDSSASSARSDTSSDTSSNSDQSSDDSSRNSTEGSSQDTSNSSRSEQDGRTIAMISIVVTVMIVGGIAIGALLVSHSNDSSGGDEQGYADLGKFMRQHHAVLTRDIVLAGGPILDAWCDDLGLSREERTAFATRLEGSPQQTALLEALSGDITREKVQAFSTTYLMLTQTAIGPARVQALLSEHAPRHGARLAADL